MHFLRLWYCIGLILIGFTNSHASHIVGGYIRYDCQGSATSTSTNYEVTVVLYRDVIRANPQAIFTQNIPITIFTQGASNVTNIGLQSTKLIADSIEDPCFVRIDSLELEEGIYKGVIELTNSQQHLLVYQRCCRNNSIDNLSKPTNDWGNTWTVEVPVFDIHGCNSSPDYANNPPIAFCPNEPINIDLSAIDSDGDSLVYSFCAPYSSPQFNPEPNPATPPPYQSVNFLPPQSVNFPLPSNPPLSFNAQSGILTGTPAAIGQYVVGFCIEEYRNGVFLSTSRRDIQINTANCNPIILTAVQDQTLLCDGRTVDFRNNTPPVPGYNVKGYRWDFGDPTTLADTSRLPNPTYTYSDTGVYAITLIANPGLRCSSDTVVNFRVYEKLDPSIQIDGLLCEDSNSVNFYAAGTFEDYATFQWSFGSAASLTTSNQDTVLQINFSGQQNARNVSLTVQQDICTETVNRLIQFLPNPRANFRLDIDEICAPFPVNFRNLSFASGSADYIWSFGDGDSSFVVDPTHEYQENGDYEVRLEVRTTDNCIDTVVFTDSVFAARAFSPNKIQFNYSPKKGCAPLEVEFRDSSIFQGSASYFWDLGRNVLSNEASPTLIYSDTGIVGIGLLLITADSCADTLRLRVDSAIRVLPSPSSRLKLSKDSVNVKEAKIEIDARESEFYSSGRMLINGSFESSENYFSYRFQDTGRYQIEWIAKNEFECLDSAQSELYVYDEFEFEIPNIFTPDGDGINDAFKVKACGVYDYSITIFNRFGKEVYRSNSLLQGWDGYINDRKASSGVYFYNIVIKDLKGEFRNYQGSLTLLK